MNETIRKIQTLTHIFIPTCSLCMQLYHPARHKDVHKDGHDHGCCAQAQLPSFLFGPGTVYPGTKDSDAYELKGCERRRNWRWID